VNPTTRYWGHLNEVDTPLKLKIGHLQELQKCDLQTGYLIFVFNNLQGERLM
jgi:hypothetical protein